MRSGTVILPSGRWHWTVLRQWTGATVVFQHRDRVHDEMRNWSPELELSDAQAAELGRDPLERTWVDVDGLRWRLTIELPSAWRAEARGLGAHEGAAHWLVFRRGGLRRLAEIPRGQHLGELTHGELREKLDEAFRRRSEVDRAAAELEPPMPG